MTSLINVNYSINYGRPPYSPDVMFKLLFLKLLYNLSDKHVIQEVQVKRAHKYFLNLKPEEAWMNASFLTH